MQVYSKDLLREVQLIELEAAKFFVEFCKKHNLLCFFCGGGCIGAVRHKGFIPWDDDLDFFMPRTDYEKLKELWVDTEQYALLFPKEEYNDHCMYITLRDKTTTMIKPYQVDMDTIHGISLDIFPLDGYPKKKWQRLFQVFWGLIFQLFCAQVVPENHGKILKIFSSIVLAAISNPKARYKIWKYAEKQMTKYRIQDCDAITEICAGIGYMKNKYPKECFERAFYTKFENTEMPIPIGYDKYLHIAFGDYMQFPPLEKQVPSHDAILVDTKKSYLNYKGEYYCIKSK